jgi:hypothetical protein
MRTRLLGIAILAAALILADQASAYAGITITGAD